MSKDNEMIIRTDEDIRKLVGSDNLRLNASIQSGDVNEAERTVALSFSSEEPVKRGFGIEILDHSPESVDLSRLLNGAPVMVDHFSDQMGVVEDARINDDRQGFALLRFSDNPRPSEIFNDIVKGIRKNISVGYKITELKLESEDDEGVRTFRASWMPYEISVVGIPADTTVGIGRSENSNEPQDNPELEALVKKQVDSALDKRKTEPQIKVNKMEKTVEEKAEDKRQLDEAVAKATKETASNIREIDAIGRQAGYTADEIGTFITEGIDKTAMLGKALDKIKSKDVTINAGDPADELPNKDKQRYSIGRVIRSMVEHTALDGLEREVSDEIRSKTDQSSGEYVVPLFAMCTDVNAAGERALSAGASPGDKLVGTDHRGDMYIDKLRNRARVMELGATVITGLRGNVDIPRQTGAVTIASLAEAAAITPSDQNFDLVQLSPKRIGGETIFSKQLLLQSNPSIDNIVRSDIMTEMMLDVDAKALQGSGAGNQPTGIANQAGINALTFTTSPTWAKVVQFETEVASDNADVDNMAYLTTAAVRGAWKTTVKEATQAVYLWENNTSPVNGYNAQVSNQITGNIVFFGDFSQLLIGFWGGVDLTIDEVTLASNAQIRIIGNQFFDVAVRHPEAFTVSTDAGNL